MEERKIASYFKHQVRSVIERSARDPEGCLSYFADHEPKVEEILGLLAVSSMMGGEFQLCDNFPSPVEALAALSPASRTEICREFRKALKSHFRQTTAA